MKRTVRVAFRLVIGRLQAAVFEAVYPAVEEIPVPAEVFEALGEPVEDRRFRYADMIGKVRSPDLNRPETLRWFVYRGLRYLQAG